MTVRFHKKNTESGYITLVLVLVIGAVAVAISSNLLLFGVDANKNVLSKDLSRQARALADACAEEALENIRFSSTFAGFGSLTINGRSCSYNVLNTGGQNRLVTASSTVGNAVRKVRVIITTVRPAITVSSWQEVADF